MKHELIELICQKSFKYSDTPIFKLASGKMSRFYINCKPVVLSPRGMFLVGHLVFNAVKDLGINGAGGLTFGADPIAIATSFTSELHKQPIQAFSIRKTRKEHGIIKWVEGDMKAGDRVVIIEDVVTTGGSTIKAIERARSEGLDVVKIVTLIDRQEGGIENIREYVKDVSSIISRDELIKECSKKV
jgi:orotate phosphoribosyltransferase